MGYYEGEIGSLNTGNNDGGFGGGWWGIVALVAVAAIFGGGNFGFGGNRNNGAVTQADLCTALNFNNLESSVRNANDGINVGFANLNSTICNQQYDTARMIDGINSNMLQGFNGINVTNLQGFNALQAQLAQCCCNLERGQERLACGEAQNAAAIIQAGNANTQRIIDYLCNDKIQSLQSAAQSQYIVNAVADRILPQARPAYLTCSPYASAFGYPYSNNNCNCNNGCNYGGFGY